MGRDKPVLGALGEMLQYGAQAIPQQQMQNATLQQRYAEFQEEKRARQASLAQRENESTQTREYQNELLRLNRIAEMNNRIQNARNFDWAKNRAEVEDQYNQDRLQLYKDELEFQKEKSMAATGDSSNKYPVGITKAMIDAWMQTREMPATIEQDAYQPSFTPESFDTLNALIQTGRLPVQSNEIAQAQRGIAALGSQANPASIMENRRILGTGVSFAQTGENSSAEEWGRQTYYNWDELKPEQKQKLIGAYYNK